MSAFVLDSSLTLAWCFQNESTPATRDALADAVRFGVLVPPLWSVEVANVLLVAKRRGRVSEVAWAELRRAMQRLPITTDAAAHSDALGGVSALADRHALTTYDATYLELAIRSGLPLGTLDRALRVAAIAVGVRLVGLE